jgi:TetR/AcrR family transcriptional regulator, transcriptional repressor for nem operon
MEDAEKIMRYPVEETAAKHQQIVKEASRLFRERGFENVSVGEVMKGAGLTMAPSMPISLEGKTAAAALAYGQKGFLRARAEQQGHEKQRIIC